MEGRVDKIAAFPNLISVEHKNASFPSLVSNENAWPTSFLFGCLLFLVRPRPSQSAWLYPGCIPGPCGGRSECASLAVACGLAAKLIVSDS